MRTFWLLMQRQVGQMWKNHIYIFSMLIFPLFITFFFTDIMKEGVPTNLPVGIVDNDDSQTSRKMIRSLDAMQSVSVKTLYSNVNEARRAVQRGEIYAFFYFPAGMEADLLAARQPTVSFYYNGSFMLAGSMAYKDMRAEATLGSAAVAMTKMAAVGMSADEILARLEPIVVDTRAVNNPTTDYNVYLSTTLIPACFGIFIFLITAYSIGTELKFNRAKQWMHLSKNNIVLALTSKMLPITIIFLIVFWLYYIWAYEYLDFPKTCSTARLFFIGLLFVLACQGFGVFIFGLLPSLRMSMSACALLAVLSFSICGFTFPLDAMPAAPRTIALIFPMRSYFMIYQTEVLNGYPLLSAWIYYVVLFGFTLLPFTIMSHIKVVMLKYEYIP